MEIARIVLACLATAGVAFAAAPPAEPGSPEPRPPGPEDVCPVCGMAVAPHEDWVAQAVFEDGSRLYFDGAKDLFRYLLERDRYAPAKRSLEIRAAFVTGYYEVESIPAEDAYFVIGSDVYGPMGAELIPHASRAEADEFASDHGGERIVRFGEVTAELLAGP